MKNIIDPIDKKLLVSELNNEYFLRKTNNKNHELYVITAHNAPNVMREIGRLREESFRNAGGGTGKEVDIDKYDIAEKPYKQLLVWNPEDQEILGGYRFILCKDAPVDENGNYILATSGLLHFSETFKKNYVPYMIELGRSFVRPQYQSTGTDRRSLFVLDNLWDGLGALIVNNPDMKYFFGKVTMYRHFNIKARDLILFFLQKHFADPENLVYPHEPLQITTPVNELREIINQDNYKDDYKILNQKVRELGENIPPLINAYMNLSLTMKVFGTSINKNFGEVEETGILLNINDIYPQKKERHIATFQKL